MNVSSNLLLFFFFFFPNSNCRSEAQLIEEIILDVSKDLNCVSSKDTQFLVGVDSCIRELELLLCLESIGVRMVGIWGMRGIGKTTLTKAIYEKISHKYEGSCFLANVGLDLARKGEDYLKQQLLSRVLKVNNIDVTITSLKTKLHSKKVSIVVDNVNNQSILKTLVDDSSWFRPQGRIIRTIRDKQFLTMYEVNVVYEVHKLQDDKAIEVFNQYAFRHDPPPMDVMNLIAHAQGLPLALEVLGSSLYKKSKDEWMCALAKLMSLVNIYIIFMKERNLPQAKKSKEAFLNPDNPYIIFIYHFKPILTLYIYMLLFVFLSLIIS